MCGRFSLTLPDFEELARLLEVPWDAALAARYRPRYNVPPSDPHWIVATPEHADARKLLPARWGYGLKKLPLARAESAPTQNLFKKAFATHRCVVPVDGFFEWSGEKGQRTPHWFHPRTAASGGAKEPPLLLLGGIWGEGKAGFDFAILTTRANDVVAPVHDRMPLVIPRDRLDAWLSGDAETAAKLLRPAPDALLVDTVVDARVNNARNDDPECLAPATAEQAETLEKQRKLFG